MLLLKKLRLERGWSQVELARRAKCIPGEISRCESGRLIPYPGQLKRLAKALGVEESKAEGLMGNVEESSFDCKQKS